MGTEDEATYLLVGLGPLIEGPAGKTAALEMDATERRLRDGQEVIGLHTNDPEQGLHKREGAVQEISEEVVGRRYKKGLTNLAVQSASQIPIDKQVTICYVTK